MLQFLDLAVSPPCCDSRLDHVSSDVENYQTGTRAERAILYLALLFNVSRRLNGDKVENFHKESFQSTCRITGPNPGASRNVETSPLEGTDDWNFV